MKKYKNSSCQTSAPCELQKFAQRLFLSVRDIPVRDYSLQCYRQRIALFNELQKRGYTAVRYKCGDMFVTRLEHGTVRAVWERIQRNERARGYEPQLVQVLGEYGYLDIPKNTTA